MAQDIFAFLHLEGIEGEAQDSEHKDKLELHSFGWGATNSSSYASGTGPSTSKGQLHDISFSKLMCKASLRLLERAVSGKPVENGTLSLVKLVGDKKMVYFEVKLKNVLVTSFHISASGGGQLPMESVTISYVETQTEYKPQGNEGDAQGKIAFGWDLQKNEAC